MARGGHSKGAAPPPQARWRPSSAMAAIFLLTSIAAFYLVRRGGQEDSSVEQLAARIKELQGRLAAIQQAADARQAGGGPPFLRLGPIFRDGMGLSDALAYSTVACMGNATADRVCKFKNLCYNARSDRFFIIKDPSSVTVEVPPKGARDYLLDKSGVSSHNRFYFDYDELSPAALAAAALDEGSSSSGSGTHSTTRGPPQAYFVDGLAFLLGRFVENNTFHTLHDDWLGLYVLHRIWAPSEAKGASRGPLSFSRSSHIFFIDDHGSLENDHWFGLLTAHPLQFKSSFRAATKDGTAASPYLCFGDAVVGNSKATTWYEYGLGGQPQGPIPNKSPPGFLVRDGARYIIERLGLAPWAPHGAVRQALDRASTRRTAQRAGGDQDWVAAPPPKAEGREDEMSIVIFSRTKNRLILNEDDMYSRLSATYGLPVRLVRMEQMTPIEQVAAVRTAAVAVGMHGALLAMALFLPPGAILIELFPYGVPAENYTPYKTMAGLRGMHLTYRSWVNMDASKSIAHPERPALEGGLAHLSEGRREEILQTPTVPPHVCCDDPFWLFRIYQDTHVNLDEVEALIDEALVAASGPPGNEASSPADAVSIFPAPVEGVACETQGAGTGLSLHITWQAPPNGALPLKYGIWLHQPYAEAFTDRPAYTIDACTEGARYDLWVRSYVPASDGARALLPGPYSEQHTCWCERGSSAIRGAGFD